jgi:hypothetical protein
VTNRNPNRLVITEDDSDNNDNGGGDNFRAVNPVRKEST